MVQEYRRFGGNYKSFHCTVPHIIIINVNGEMELVCSIFTAEYLLQLNRINEKF